MIVLYDADCGFCRWATAWAVRHDHQGVLVTVPIQSPLGSEILVNVIPGDRLRSAHVLRDDGCRRSGGAAAAELLSVLPATRALGRLASSSPRVSALLYGLVVAQRKSFGRLVSTKARRRADDLLGATSVTTAAESCGRDRRASDPPAP